MSAYRLYFLNATDNIHDYRTVECDSDGDAVAAAEELRIEHPWIEIWCGVRMVHGWRPPANRVHTVSAPDFAEGRAPWRKAPTRPAGSMQTTNSSRLGPRHT